LKVPAQQGKSSGAIAPPVHPEAFEPFDVPVAVPSVEPSILDQCNSWADPKDYDRTAAQLVDPFLQNFA
jgi:ATP-dependent phosphoenolpyruvate carboxykinase